MKLTQIILLEILNYFSGIYTETQVPYTILRCTGVNLPEFSEEFFGLVFNIYQRSIII